MNPHLSNEDFVRYLGGDETTRVQAHLDECPECRSEASRLLEVIGSARSRVEAIGGRADATFWVRQRNAVRERTAIRQRKQPSWALAAALAALLVVTAFMFRTPEPRSKNLPGISNTQHTVAAVSDDALLSSVNNAIQQDVPQAMAPLQQLAYEREQAEKRSNRQN